MGLYTPVAGQTLTGSFLNNAILNVTPQIITKAGDTSRNTTTTFTNDPDFQFTGVANLTYYLDSVLYYDAGATPLIKFQVVAPGAATVQQVLVGLETSVAAASGIIRMGRNSQAVGGPGAGSVAAVALKATIVMAATPGTIAIQWAQNTSNATASILKAQSVARLTATPQ